MSSLYTQTVKFGVSNGPTFTGAVNVPASGNDVPRIYQSLDCLHGATTTIDASGFKYANWLAMGFQMQLDPVQTGTPTDAQKAAATVTVHLVDALSGGATDYTIALNVGQAVSWVVIPPTIVHDVASITVVGDTNCDCDINGILLVSA